MPLHTAGSRHRHSAPIGAFPTSALAATALVCLLLAGPAAAEFYENCAAPRFPLYESPSGGNCSPYAACEADYCACMGAEFDGTTCDIPPRDSSQCDDVAVCIGRYVNCVNNQSVAGRCGRLLELYVELLTIASGTLYNESAAYAACQYTACSRFNASFLGQGCEVSLERDRVTCSPTVEYDGQIVLSAASWRSVLSRFGGLGAVKSALQTDLRAFLTISQAAVLSVGMGDGERLIASFNVPGASESNALVVDAVAAAKPGRNWITNTLAAYTAYGGTQLEADALEVLCFGAGCWPTTAAVSSAPGGPSTSLAPGVVHPGSTSVPTIGLGNSLTSQPPTAWSNTVAVSSGTGPTRTAVALALPLLLIARFFAWCP